MLMYYAFTLDSVFKSVEPNGSEPTWQTSMLYSDIVPLIYVNETICMVICPLQDSSQSFYDLEWIICAKIIRKGILWMRGLVPSWVLRHSFLSLTDCWWLYNIQLKTSSGVLLLPPSDAYVRSFLYLLYTLIKLCYTKALSDPASCLAPDWICLLQRPRIPASYHSATTFCLCPNFDPISCSTSGSNCCFLTCIQVSQETVTSISFRNFQVYCDPHSQRL